MQCSCSSEFLIPLSDCTKCQDSIEVVKEGGKEVSKRDMFESYVKECSSLGLQPLIAGSEKVDGSLCGFNPV